MAAPADSFVAPPSAAPPAEDRRVAAALQEYLAALEAGRRPDRTALLARHPDLAAILREAMDGLEFLHGAMPPTAAPPDPLPAPAGAYVLGDFRIVREVGRGGMGVVYEAEQLSLNRRVALKVLPFASALDERHLQRFKNEAQAAAHLHHPHIVPVHAVGCDRGVHYYAMQFIDGQTVADLIRDLRGAEPSPGPDPSAAPTSITGPYAPDAPTSDSTRPRAALSTSLPRRGPAYFKALAKLGIQAAEALEYAHSMGVVHRDVKPANLLLDARGHLWVTDFGLAQVQTGSGLTVSGDLLGTVKYMSPEQARGGRSPVDHHTDVYSLGVTLYELFTLHAPYPGHDRQELLRHILGEEPRPPRKVCRGLPPELDTIVLKALAKDPAERYATAQELADDLRRFIDDQPIRARRPTWTQVASKWSRRHRGLVHATLVLLFVSVLVLAGSLVWVVKAKERADTALRQASAELEYSRQVVDEMYVKVHSKLLDRDPSHRPLQKEILEKALAFYTRFAREKGNAPAVRLERARAALRVGDIRQKLGDLSGASLAYNDAAEQFQELHTEFPANPTYARELAWCCNSRGILAINTHQSQAAVDLFRRAVELQSAVVAAEQDNIKARYDLASHHDNLGAAYLGLHRFPDARKCFTAALDLLLPLGESSAVPSDEHRKKLATIHHNMGVIHHMLQQPQQAQEHWTRAQGINRQLAAAHPFRPEYQEDMANSALSMGVLCYEIGRYEEAENYCRQAQDVYGRLLRQYANVAEYRAQHVRSTHALSRTLTARGKYAEAEAAYRRCLELLDELALAFPELQSMRVEKLRCRIDLARLLNRCDKPDEALTVQRQALADAEAEATRVPNTPDARFLLLTLKNNLANALCGTGNVAEAESLLRGAVRIGEELITQHGATPEYRIRLGGINNNLGDLLGQLGRSDDAEQAYVAALAQFSRLAVDMPEDAMLPLYRAQQLVRLATVREAQGRTADARTYYQDAGDVVKRVLTLPKLAPLAKVNAAWFYAACPDPQTRDLARAHELADQARQELPEVGDSWRTIGLVRLRRGDAPGAVEALRTAQERFHGSDRITDLLLAQSLRQAGKAEEARATYDEACRRMARAYEFGAELHRFRAEADAAFATPTS